MGSFPRVPLSFLTGFHLLTSDGLVLAGDEHARFDDTLGGAIGLPGGDTKSSLYLELGIRRLELRRTIWSLIGLLISASLGLSVFTGNIVSSISG